MDFKRLRADFPIFNEKRPSPKYVYLDSASTSHKPQAVIDALTDFYLQKNASVHRGVYDGAESATIAYEEVRQKVAAFIGAACSSEIVFTPGTTAGINFIAGAWASKNMMPGDEILVTQADHHANFLPWQRIAQERQAILRVLSISAENYMISCTNQAHESVDHNVAEYCIDAACRAFKNIVTERTKLIAIPLVSNVLGDIWGDNTGTLKALISRAHEVGAFVLIDAAQAVGHQVINVQELGADFVVFSGHKMLGPTGVGVLYINKKLHAQVEPYQVGGGMVFSAAEHESRWQMPPHKFEAGTPPVASIIGLGAAIDYISERIDYDSLRLHYALLMSYLVEELALMQQPVIIGNLHYIISGSHIINIMVRNIHAHDLAGYLASEGVAVRAGHHCAQPLAHALGYEATLRISFHAYTTREDIDQFVGALKNACVHLGKL